MGTIAAHNTSVEHLYWGAMMPAKYYAGRDALVLRMRGEGASFQAIAEAIGATSREAGRKAYYLALERVGRVAHTAVSAIREIPPEDEFFVSWAAGFFDGEGCVSADISMWRGHEKHGLVALIDQTTPEPLLAFQRRWGGNIRDRAPTQKHWQHQWYWALHGRSAEPFLRDIQPYLRVKAEHVALALQFIALIKSRGVHITEEERRVRRPILISLQLLNARRHSGRRKDRVA